MTTTDTQFLEVLGRGPASFSFPGTRAQTPLGCQGKPNGAWCLDSEAFGAGLEALTLEA